jgi:hypothetical protein
MSLTLIVPSPLREIFEPRSDSGQALTCPADRSADLVAVTVANLTRRTRSEHRWFAGLFVLGWALALSRKKKP